MQVYVMYIYVIGEFKLINYIMENLTIYSISNY